MPVGAGQETGNATRPWLSCTCRRVFDGFGARDIRLRRFIAMKLKDIQTAFAEGLRDEFLRRVDEYTDSGHERRHLAYNLPRGLHGDVTRTFVVKHKAQQVGARLDRRLGVRQVRDAADFDFGAHAFRGP